MGNSATDVADVRIPRRRDSLILAQIGVRRSLEWVFRPFLRPGLNEFARAARFQTPSARSLLQDRWGAIPSQVETLASEFGAVWRDVERSPRDGLPYPSGWRIEREHALFVYGLVRILRPDRIVETGVANGISSWLILGALDQNGQGRLVSVDVRDDVGTLVPRDLRDRWDLTILGRSGGRHSLREVLRAARPLDMFLHDSAHTYGHQLSEYRAAWSSLTPTGTLLSDDADA
ncbi:MAG TPA: class I SAM-dependent methyltransferase, partial [Thermoplasmata archaeon]|nr:class I SAM-dependent methyltransferase [Thermoplasmata archaeon]